MAPKKKATPAVENNETIETKAVVSESVAEETTPVKKTRTRKTAAKTADTTASEEVKTTKTTKKAAAKKADEPKAAKTTTRKTAAKKAAEAEAPAPKAEIFIEYGGAQVSVDEIIANARKIVGNDKDIKVYVQPDTSKAYIAFGEESVAMDVFFCK